MRCAKWIIVQHFPKIFLFGAGVMCLLHAEPRAVGQLPANAGEECPVPISSAEYSKLIAALRAERDGLNGDWKSFTHRMKEPKASLPQDDAALQAQLKLVLQKLREERTRPVKSQVPDLPVLEKKIDPDPVEKKKTNDPAPTPTPASELGTLDALHLGHALFRAGRYDEALTSFRKVDLSGKKAEERVPVLYLMGACLVQLGRPDEAAVLWRDAANSRGDEDVARHAQWQLDLLRWQRDTRERLHDVRQRLKAMEKRL